MPVAIFDMDGVLYRGSIVMPYAKETLDRLRKAGWQVFFATNNSTATRDEYVSRLVTLGLGGDLEHVITSAYATAHYLERLVPKPQDVLVIGADGLRSEIRAVGISVRDASALPGIHPPQDAAADGVDPGAMRRYLTSMPLPPTPDTVVVGLDLHLTYAKLAEAQRAILAGARFICSNRDRAYPVEGRLLPGAGSIVAAIEVATGQRALCVGKPEPFLFEEALRRASLGDRSGGAAEKGPAVVIGDSTDYDMVAAHRVGAVGVLILTGLTEEAALHEAKGEAAPDRVVRSLEELFALPEFAGI
jgi:phosphoglycolate/pyridoxal phosphate phosphatase family enzyme